MKRSTLTTGERADHAEQVKKLTKHVSECVRRANAALGEAGTVWALFSAQAVGVRARLRDACQRVILFAPGTQARRMEEILWRKVYYEPLSSAKKMRKGTTWTSSEACWVYNHLWSGIAYYHQLLHSQAQSNHFHSHMADLLPYPNEDDSSKVSVSSDGGGESLHRCLTCLGDLTRYMLDLPSPPPHSLSVRYYLQALHYQPEGGLTHSNLATVYSTNDQSLLAVAHYLRALTCEKTFEGAEGNLKRLLDKSRAVYESGTELREVDTSHTYHHKMFLHTVLTLVSHLINNRKSEDVARMCQDVLVQLGKVLESYDDADNEVSETSPTPGSPPNGHLQTTTFNGHDSPGGDVPEKKVTPFSLTPEAMVAVCAVFCICTQRLKKQVSTHTSMAQALLVSVLLTLISHVTSRLEQRISLVDPSFLTRLLPEQEKEQPVEEKSSDPKEQLKDSKGNADSGSESNDGKKKSKNKRNNRLANLRRRRRLNGDGLIISDEEESDSDGSSNEDDKEEDEDEEIISSDDEEEEEELDFSQLCSSEDDDDDSDADVKIESDQWEGLTAGEHLQLIGQEGMLSAVFVACDWLTREDEVIHLFIKTADSLWKAIAKLLNLLKVDLDHLKNHSQGVREEVIDLVQHPVENKAKCSDVMLASLQNTPLPEDLLLHPLIPTYHASSHKSLNLKTTELVLLRVERILKFGRGMSGRSDTPLWCNADTGKYSVSMEGVVITEKNRNKENEQEGTSRESSASPTEEELLSVPPAKRDSRRLAGMQSLTAQWLQHEVRNLEERTARRATLGLYLVPDATVLINHLSAIKMLLSKPTHMIIIPQTVIDLLDQQKRESLGARDAIRWLEIKFRHGSRFIRAQRPHERTHLPLIKYPKRKDKEAWEWYQILECCHYLSAQVQQNSSVKSATVTLLTGGSQHPPNSTFSHSGLAHAAGAVLENIEEFMRKWQTSTKGHS